MFEPNIPNADFLNALAYKRNWAGMEAQRQNQLQYAQQLNALQERDMQNGLAQQDAAAAYLKELNSQPILERDRQTLQDKEKELGAEVNDVLENKFNGDVGAMYHSREGRLALHKYKQGLANVFDEKWKANAVNKKLGEDIEKAGKQSMPFTHPENGKEYSTMQDQTNAYNAGDINSIIFSGALNERPYDRYTQIATKSSPTKIAYEEPSQSAKATMQERYPNASENTKWYKDKVAALTEEFTKNPAYYKAQEDKTLDNMEKSLRIQKLQQDIFKGAGGNDSFAYSGDWQPSSTMWQQGEGKAALPINYESKGLTINKKDGMNIYASTFIPLHTPQGETKNSEGKTSQTQKDITRQIGNTWNNVNAHVPKKTHIVKMYLLPNGQIAAGADVERMKQAGRQPKLFVEAIDKNTGATGIIPLDEFDESFGDTENTSSPQNVVSSPQQSGVSSNTTQAQTHPGSVRFKK